MHLLLEARDSDAVLYLCDICVVALFFSIFDGAIYQFYGQIQIYVTIVLKNKLLVDKFKETTH